MALPSYGDPDLDAIMRNFAGSQQPAAGTPYGPNEGPQRPFPPNAGPQRAKPGMLGAMAQEVPTLMRGARAVGAGARALAPVAKYALPVAGTAMAVGNEAMNIDEAPRSNTPLLGIPGTDTGVATAGAESVSRLAMMGAGAGLGTAAGLATGPFAPVATPVLATLLGGLGYIAPNAAFGIRDWLRGDKKPKPAGAPAPAAVATPTPAAVAAPAPRPLTVTEHPAITALLAGRTEAAGPAPALAAPAPRPFTSQDFDEGRMPVAGTGAIRRGGVVTTFGAPRPAAPAASAQSPMDAAIAAQERYLAGQRRAQLEFAEAAAASGDPRNATARYRAALGAVPNPGGGDFVATAERAATARANNAATTAVARANALTASQDRQDRLLLALYGPEAMEKLSAAELNAARLGAAMLIKDPERRAAATMGRTPPADRLELVPPMPGKPLEIANLTKGTAIKVTPRTPANEANLVAEMKSLKLPNTPEGRAQGKAALENKGYSTAGIN